jgi:hypothetical protein
MPFWGRLRQPRLGNILSRGPRHEDQVAQQPTSVTCHASDKLKASVQYSASRRGSCNQIGGSNPETSDRPTHASELTGIEGPEILGAIACLDGHFLLFFLFRNSPAHRPKLELRNGTAGPLRLSARNDFKAKHARVVCFLGACYSKYRKVRRKMKVQYGGGQIRETNPTIKPPPRIAQTQIITALNAPDLPGA